MAADANANPIELTRKSEESDPRWAGACGVILVAAGILLRLGQYLFNRSLFIDEAALALNIRDRNAVELLARPLEGAQTGAPLFILLLRALVVLLGDAELVVRLPSMVGSLLAMYLFYRLAGRLVSHPWHLFATFLFAFNFPLIAYSADVKPYGVDVLASCVILLVVLPARSGGLNRGRAAYLACVGAVLLSISQPAVFVILPALLLLATRMTADRDWISLRRLSMVAIVWALAGGVTLWYSRRALGAEGMAYMDLYWADAFLPFPPFGREQASAYILSALGFGISPVGSIIPGIVVFALVGLAALIVYDRWTLALLSGPITLTIIASIAQLYPFRSTLVGQWPDGRVVLFLTPAVIILMGHAMALFWRSRYESQRRIVLLASLLVMAGNLVLFRDYPVQREEIRPVLAEVEADFRPDDYLYLYYGGQYAYRYYASRTTIPVERVFFGKCARNEPATYLEELWQFRGLPRVWILASHPYRDEVDDIFRALEEHGTALHVIDGADARAGLFDLRSLPQEVPSVEAYFRATREMSRGKWECGVGIHRNALTGFGGRENSLLHQEWPTGERVGREMP